MIVVDTIEAVRGACTAVGRKVGLVPTMGALHAGHLALVKQARNDNDFVVTSIFVNPTQFSKTDDLSRYPRNLGSDLELLENAGVDLVFTPTPTVMYPPGFQTWVDVAGVSNGLEGARRPGHFRGVTTIVAKLFNLVQPRSAYFGQKDAQQVAVIKRMVRDLDFPIQIVVCPTVREPNGLAMSSRNVYLSAEQRQSAGGIYRALRTASEVYVSGGRDPVQLRSIVAASLKDVPGGVLDYVSVANAITLQEVEAPSDDPILVSLVVEIAGTRLLDNILLPAELNNLEGLTRVLGGV